MLNELIKHGNFDGCDAGFHEAETVLIGAGYDGTSSYRPGSRFAPVAIRAETLYSQETYSPYFESDLSDCRVHDCGDLELPPGNKAETLRKISEAADFLLQMRKRPCFIGGEHLISLPVIEATLKHYPDLVIVQLDAHLDMIDELFGDKLSHGTVMRRSLEILGENKRIWQLAVRSGGKEEFDFARKHNNVYPFTLSSFLAEQQTFDGKPVYVTLDLDVFDPSLVPGTGTPEAGGIFFAEYMQFLQRLTRWNVVAMDVVELAPKLDSSGTSTIVASKVLREMLIASSTQ